MYPPAPVIIRRVTKNYTVPDTNNVQITNDTVVLIPVYAIQRDPDYFPNPDQFNPDRFSPANIHKLHKMSFIPFGEGPRNCIGERFGMMQARIGLITLLRNFAVSPCAKTKAPKFDIKNVLLSPADGIWLNIQKIKK